MTLNYSQLREIQRKETESSAPVPLQEGFYQSVADLLLQKKKEALDTGSLQIIREYDNIRKILLFIQAKREEKIVFMVLRGEGNCSSLTSEEIGLFSELKTIVSRSRETIRSSLESIGSLPGKPTAGLDNALNIDSASLIKIKVLKEIGQYKGNSDVVYGPYSEGQELELPRLEAEWLVRAGLAEPL